MLSRGTSQALLVVAGKPELWKMVELSLDHSVCIPPLRELRGREHLSSRAPQEAQERPRCSQREKKMNITQRPCTFLCGHRQMVPGHLTPDLNS